MSVERVKFTQSARKRRIGKSADHSRDAVLVPEAMMTARNTRKHAVAPGPDVDLERDVVRDSRGRRITEQYAQRAVDKTHRQLGRGRPSLTGRASRSPQVTFRLPPELKDKAEQLAAREGKRVSDVARDALRDYLARRRVS